MAVARQKLISAFGTLLVVLSLIFVGSRLVRYKDFLLTYHWGGTTVAMLAGGALVYMSACFLLSSAWAKLLGTFGRQPADAGLCHYIYARTLIAKYIPGNVFQIVGRHMLGNRLGLGHEQLAYAAFYELLGVSCVSSLIALAGFIGTGFHQQFVSPGTMVTLFLVTFILTFLVSRLLPFLARAAGYTLTVLGFRQTIRQVVPIYAYYLLFFSVSGGILLGMLKTIAPATGWSALLIAFAAFSLSWLAGFITPGSPSGLGVREAVLVFTLGGFIGEGGSVLIALLLRVVTILGDLLYFTVATIQFRPHADAGDQPLSPR